MKILLILTRIYINEIDSAVKFYEDLSGEKCSSRFEYKEAGLEIARVNNFLIIAGTDESLAPFRSTQATILTDSLTEIRDFHLRNGGSVVRDIQKVPTGLNMTVKHNDGTIIEYVEFS